jgi:phage anti-repressor protein
MPNAEAERTNYYISLILAQDIDIIQKNEIELKIGMNSTNHR